MSFNKMGGKKRRQGFFEKGIKIGFSVLLVLVVFFSIFAMAFGSSNSGITGGVITGMAGDDESPILIGQCTWTEPTIENNCNTLLNNIIYTSKATWTGDPESPVAADCVDSIIVSPCSAICNDTDGRFNYNVAGQVTDSLFPGGLADSCIDSSYLLEYYCSYFTNFASGSPDGYYATSVLHECPYGCSEGSCNHLEINSSKGSLNIGDQNLITIPSKTGSLQLTISKVQGSTRKSLPSSDIIYEIYHPVSWRITPSEASKIISVDSRGRARYLNEGYVFVKAYSKQNNMSSDPVILATGDLIGDPQTDDVLAVFPLAFKPEGSNYSFGDMLIRYPNYISTLNTAYKIQRSLYKGFKPYGTGKQVLALLDLPYHCGGNNNPLETDPCCYMNCGNGEPQYNVVIHEIGHNFADKSRGLNQLIHSNNDRLNQAGLGECIASLPVQYIRAKLYLNPANYGFTGTDYEYLNSEEFYLFDNPDNKRRLALFEELVANGTLTGFSDVNLLSPEFGNSLGGGVGVICSMFVTPAAYPSEFGNNHGWDFYTRFFNLFNDHELSNFDENNVDTYFAATYSAAMELDMRERMRGWGFIIDDAYFNQLYPEFLNELSGKICTDSDSGLDYFVKGYVNTSVSSDTYFEDYCLPGHPDQLIERHCLDIQNPYNFTVQYTCPNGCYDGACLSGLSAEDYAVIYGASSSDLAAATDLVSSLTVSSNESSVNPVSDIEVSTVSNKNLLVVGNPCNNILSNNILFGGVVLPANERECKQYIGEQIGVGPGQWLIQIFASPYDAEKIAVVISGYEAAQVIDAVNAFQEHITELVSAPIGTRIVGPALEESCTDSDGGLDYYTNSACTDSFGILPDGCIVSDGENTGWLRETSCEDRGNGNRCQMSDFYCPNGCIDGACAIIPEVPLLALDLQITTPDSAVVGQETAIQVKITNYGTIDADEIKLVLELPNWTEESYDWTTLDSEIISEGLGAGETLETTLHFTPSVKDYSSLRLSASASGKDSFWQGESWTYVRALSNGKDASMYLYSPLAVLGYPSYVHVNLENLGNQDISEINISLFLDNVFVNSTTASLLETGESQGRYAYAPILFVPTNSGEHNTRVVADVEGDVDTSDNERNQTIHIYAAENVSFSLNSPTGRSFERYLYTPLLVSPTSDFLKVQGPATVTLPFLKEDYFNSRESAFAIIYAPNLEEDKESISAGQLYSGLDIGEEESAVTEYYPAFSQNGTNYVSVFANEVSFDYNSTMFYGVVNESELRRTGLALDYFNCSIKDYWLDCRKNPELYYSAFYCKDFDFSRKQCRGEWIESNQIDNDRGYDSARGQIIMAITGISDEKAEAWAIGQSVRPIILAAEETGNNRARNIILEKANVGELNILGEVSIENYSLNELANYIKISSRKMFVDTDALPELKNTSAKLTFYDIELKSPKILYNGKICPPTVCINISYNKSNKILVFYVSGFSEFEVIEGDTSTRRSTSSSTSTLTDNLIGACTPEWTCGWSECMGEHQTLTCADLNACGVLTDKPQEETRACTNEDAASAAGTEADEEMQTEEKNVLKTLLLLMIVIIGVIAVILILALFRKPKAAESSLAQYSKSQPTPSRKQETSTSAAMLSQAKEIVKDAREKGYTDAEIRQRFEENGWSTSDIDIILM